MLAILISKGMEVDMKKYLSILLLIICLLGSSAAALASDITNAIFYGTIIVTNNGTANTTISVNMSLDSASLMDVYDVDEAFDRVAIRSSTGADVPFMPGYGNNPWMLYFPSMIENGSLNYILYIGQTDLDATKYMFLNNSMTITDDPNMELSDNYTLRVDDVFLNGTSDNIAYKVGAYQLQYTGANVTISVTGGTTLSSAVAIGECDIEIRQQPSGNTSISSLSYGGNINTLWGDDTYIYAVGATTQTVRKYLKSDLSYIGQTASYGGSIVAIWGDDTYVYAGGATTQTVRKYLKSDLSYIGQTASYGGIINAIWGDDTHIYIGGGIPTRTIQKYLKSDLSYIGQTAGYGGDIVALWGDDTHVYAGGATTQTVREYLKSDLSYIGQTASYGGTIWGVWGDDTHIYVGGETTQTVREYLKSDLSYIGQTASYGGSIFALWGDDTHVYAGGATTQTVRKYLKSDLSYIGQTANYGGNIGALLGDNTHVYAGGATTQTVNKYTIDYMLLLLNNITVAATHNVVSVPDTANPTIVGSAATSYIGEFNTTHDGLDTCIINWEYGATFTDDSGNGNDATPTLLTATSDPDVSAYLATFNPINISIPPAYAVNNPPTFIGDNITMSGQFTTGNVSTTGGPPGFALVSDIANAGDVPNIWLFGIIALCLSIAGHLFWIWMQRRYNFRSLWPFFFTGVFIFGMFIALGGTVKVFDFWMMVFYVVIFICIMVMSRHTEVGGNVSTHGMIGFAAQSWIGLTLINKMLESTFVGASETAWVNTFAFTQHFKVFNMFSIPVLNLDFWTKGIPSLFRWDYSFFGGNAQMFQYLLYSLTAVVAFIVFTMVVGMLYNFFTGR
jgi:hypothetical protein